MLTLPSSLGFDMVDVFVGPAKQRFHVHRKLLCSKSDYFQKMFEGAFKEGIDQAATLPEEDPDLFALLIHWVYTGCLKPIDINQYQTSADPDSDAFLDRIKLYGYAEKICLPLLMDYIMTNLMAAYDKLRKYPSLKTAIAAFEISFPDSHIRKFMSQSVAWYIADASTYNKAKIARDPADVAQAMAECQDLAVDVIKHLSGLNSTSVSNPLNASKCDFHQHKFVGECAYKNASEY
jgi:hypothetical protein